MDKSFKKKYIKIQQDGVVMYLMKFNVDELLENTFVEIYNSETEDGYQRQLVPNHYKKIARFLNENKKPIMPTSIICAIDYKNIKEENNYIIFKDKLRVVDGQHRREAFNYNNKNNKTNPQYEFPIIIIVVKDKEDKMIEIETFININNKGKKVKTDLAIELKEKLRKNKSHIFKNKNELIESISLNISKECNQNYNSLWKNKIRLAEESVAKPISINSFQKALHKIVSEYIDIKMNEDFEIELYGIRYNNMVQELTNFVIEAWNIVYYKWPVAFDEYKKYNITKNVGVNSISKVLAKIISEKKELHHSLRFFERTINSYDGDYVIWRKGGKFSGKSSEQGFKEIAEEIMKYKNI